METLFNGFTLNIPPDCFPLSTDSMVLSDFIRLPKNARVLDLGSGCGTLGLLLCGKDPNCTVAGVELDSRTHEAALENIAANGLASRMESVCADIRSIPTDFSPGSFSVCVSNPPYFSGGFASQTHPLARQEAACTPEDLFAAAAWALQYGGDLYLVHKPERLAQLCACAGRHGLEAKRLRLIRHREDGNVSLILLQFRKGGKPGLQWEEAALFTHDNQPTPYYRALYHL